MKLFGSLAVAVLLGMSLAGCARERNQMKSDTPRTLIFSRAGVSLAVGDEWQYSNLDSSHTLRPPTLVSQAGTLCILLLPPDRSEPRMVAEGLHTLVVNDRQAARHSFSRQELFGTSGLRIIYVSYAQQAERDGRPVEFQNRHYLLKNRDGRCVAIKYLARAGGDADSVHRMILGSLALQ